MDVMLSIDKMNKFSKFSKTMKLVEVCVIQLSLRCDAMEILTNTH
jgi:hypothetical protein